MNDRIRSTADTISHRGAFPELSETRFARGKKRDSPAPAVQTFANNGPTDRPAGDVTPRRIRLITPEFPRFFRSWWVFVEREGRAGRGSCGVEMSANY